jgi:hypothetical protein
VLLKQEKKGKTNKIMNKTKLNILIIQIAKETIKDKINNQNNYGATLGGIIEVFIAARLIKK